MDDPNLQSVVKEFVKFVFHRYAPLNTPTDQQIENALNDFRKKYE